MKRAADMAIYAAGLALVLLVAAVTAGWLAGERQFEGKEFSFSSDVPFDWVLALLAAGPFLVGASVLLGVSLICRAIAPPDAS
jgi:hypothetical protein